MAGRRASPQLIGRSGELSRLLDTFDDVRGGAVRSVLVVGEAGIGKSRLIDEISKQVSSRATVLTGACAPMGEGALPYAPILEALHQRRGGSSRARLLVELGISGPQKGDRHQRARVFAEILDRLDRRAARRTTILVIEDLHWAGETTIELLGYLLRNQPRRLLPVITYRRGEVSDRIGRLMGELARLPSVEILDLQPLSPTEMREMLASVLGQPPEDTLVRDVHARSGGNPFLAEELLAAIQRGETADIPDRLRDILVIRLLDLPQDSLRTIRAAAVLGTRMAHAVLRRTLRISHDRLDRATADLAERQLLSPATAGGGGWRFRHDLMREAVYASIPRSERDELHGRAARALIERRELARGASTNAEIAEHLLAAGRSSDAVPYLTSAGDEARRVFAFREALGWYERALQALPPGDAAEARASLLASMAEAAALGGEGELSEELGQRATALLDEADNLVDAYRLRAQRAHWLWMNGREEFARTLWDELRDAHLTPEVRQLPEVLAVQARLADPDRDLSQRFAREAVKRAQAEGRRDIEAEALVWVGMSAAQTGRLDEGLAALRRAARLFSELHDISQYWYASHLLVAILGEAERFEEAVDAGEEQRRKLIELGVEPKTREGFLANLRDLFWWLGRWDQALAEVDGALRLNINDNAACDLLLLRAAILVGRGEHAAAKRDLEEAVKRGYRRVQESYIGSVSLLRAQLALAEDRLDAAAGEVDRGIEAVLRTDDAREDMLHDLILLGMRIQADRAVRQQSTRSQAGGGDPAAHAAALLRQLRARRAWRDPRYTLFEGHVATSWYQARAEARRLRGVPAPLLWGNAAAGWAKLHRPEAEAYARLRLGESLLAEPSHREAGAEELSRAHRLAVSLGAEPLRRAVEAAGSRAGVAEALTASAGTELASHRLTPREQEVLALLPLGWSNKEIGVRLGISEKTAEIHVSNVLHKLGVERRVEAALRAVQLGLVPLDRAASPGGPPETTATPGR